MSFITSGVAVFSVTYVPAVTGLTASNPQETTVDLAWIGARSATSYSIVSTPATTTQTTSGTSYTFTGLSGSTSYTFTVTSVGAAGSGGSTTSSSVTTLDPTPGTVTNFVASNPQETTVDLVWDPALYATSYSIESSPPGTWTQTTSDTFITFIELTPNTEYTFTITPTNATGNGPPTTSDPISTLLPLPGSGPAMYSDPTNVTATTMDLAWFEAVPEYATSFNVNAYSVLGGLIGFVNVPISSFSYTYTGLTPGTEYYFNVAGVNATGVGEAGGACYNTFTLDPTPGTVTNFVASNPQETTVDLVWDPALYATSYSIESSPPGTWTQTTSDTFITFIELTPNTEYTFTITPTNATGNGPPTTSDPISTLLPLPGSGPAMYSDPTNVTATTMDLAWFEAVPEYATSFNVNAYSVLGGLIGFVNVPISSFSYTYTGLTPGTEYYFAVAGVNVTGVGEAGGACQNTFTLE